MDRGRAVLGVFFAAAVLLAVPSGAVGAGPCGAAGVLSGPGTPGMTLTCTYTTAGEDTFVVPAGVTKFEVTAIGAPGGAGHSGFGGAGGVGGLGARAIAPLTLSPGQTLYVEVGSAGQGSPEPCSSSHREGGSGGVNGGGDGGPGRCELWGGAGGGGASDLRSSLATSGGLTAAPGDPRLIVAGGGGGAGSGANSNAGNGGDAGFEGTVGAGAGGEAGGCEAFGSPGADGLDGGVGAGGGMGGGPLSCFLAQPGHDGQAGLGAEGGDGDSANSSGGGGGGGGYVGGGGGGSQAPNGGGGGGGGSSFGPAGTTYETASVSDAPSVAISWLVPPATPTLTGKASVDVELGGRIHVTATLSGGSSPAGAINFAAYGPDDATCSGVPAFTGSTNVSGNGSYDSPDFTPLKIGAYRWVASYPGDTRNAAAVSGCGEATTVSPPPLILCSPPGAPNAAGYKPVTKLPSPRLVPGVRAKIKVAAPARLQIGVVLAYRLGGQDKTADLGTHTLDNPSARNLRLALPAVLRKRLPLGTKVRLRLEVVDAGACGSPQQLTVSTRVVRLQPNT